MRSLPDSTPGAHQKAGASVSWLEKAHGQPRFNRERGASYNIALTAPVTRQAGNAPDVSGHEGFSEEAPECHHPPAHQRSH